MYFLLCTTNQPCFYPDLNPSVQTLAAGLAPGLLLLPFRTEKNHLAAASNLAQARNEAKELGDERRKELRKRVKDIKAAESRLGVDRKDDA
jgi:hypothetical protein